MHVMSTNAWDADGSAVAAIHSQDNLRTALTSDKYNIVLQNHMYGLPPAFYDKFPVLKQWYNIVSTSKDRNGVEYVSTMEGKKYPFSGECDGVWGGSMLGYVELHNGIMFVCRVVAQPIHYLQHATATCCQQCLIWQEWHLPNE